MLELKTIVCAADFSEISDNALRYAIQMAEKFGASLHIVHVCHPPSLMLNDAEVMLPADFHEEYRKVVQQRVDELVAGCRNSGVNVQGELREGVPQDEIIAFAKERSADLVVLGTHGHRGFTHLLLGSVAERVVRKAGIPVLTIPKQEDAGA
jgi:nucleotide-binding universal stress UspA family protein